MNSRMAVIIRLRVRKTSRTSGWTARSAYRCRYLASTSAKPLWVTLSPVSGSSSVFPNGSGRRDLASNSQSADSYRHFPGSSPEKGAFHTDPVPEVHQLQEVSKALVPEDVLPEIGLNGSGSILQVAEGALPVATKTHHAASDADGRAVSLVVEFFRVLFLCEELQCVPSPMGSGVPVGERLDSLLFQKIQLLPADSHYLALIVGHAAPTAPNFFRNASMKGSSLPSMTPCTSPTFSSVRWSEAIV